MPFSVDRCNPPKLEIKATLYLSIFEELLPEAEHPGKMEMASKSVNIATNFLFFICMTPFKIPHGEEKYSTYYYIINAL